MAEMLTINQYAAIHNKSPKTISWYARKGRIGGVQRQNIPGGFRYLIPADSEIPVKKHKLKQKIPKHQRDYADPWQPPIPDVPDESEKPMTSREIVLFVRKNAGKMTYGQISRKTGMPTMKLRQLYDRLHERYGI